MSKNKFRLASEPVGIKQIGCGRVFVHEMSDGTVSASLDADLSENAPTTREALEELASALRHAAADVDHLAATVGRPYGRTYKNARKAGAK